jgi:heat shock protein beta
VFCSQEEYNKKKIEAEAKGEEFTEDAPTPVMKTEYEDVQEFVVTNNDKPIWVRSPRDVEADAYNEFFKSTFKEFLDPLAYNHFAVEGDIEFRSILYVPGMAPFEQQDMMAKSRAIKLYVRRVFISDEFDELLPKYLSFIKGIVDSDTLPLNVSRETLQQHTSLKTIKKKLVRKALDMIRKLAEEGQDDDEDEEAAVATDDSADEEETKYDKFWKNYGKAIKLGIIEDASNRTRLAKLMRFYTSKSPTKLVSLEQYVERMKPGQKSIYYLAGESREALEKSPFLEKLLHKDLEVIYFTDPIDEYTMQNLTEFDDFKFSNASKEDLKFGDDTDAAKARLKKVKEEFKDFIKWWKEILPSEDVEAVKISNRLVTTPCSVVTSKYGWSANMERIMKAQALSDDGRMAYMRGRKTLEINPGHPIIKTLKEKSEDDADDEDTKRTALIMYETALLESGFMFEEPKGFAGRLFDMVRRDLGVEADAEVEEPDVDAEPDAAAEEAPKDEL